MLKRYPKYLNNKVKIDNTSNSIFRTKYLVKL